MASSLPTCKSYQKYEVRRRQPNPKASALLVIDVQNYFSSMVKPTLHNLLTTISLCRRASIPVFFTRHCHKSPADHGMLGEWWNGDLVFDGTPESELIPELDRRPDDVVLEKNTYSGFEGTRLEEILNERGREAFVKGFRVFFSADATATANAELQDASLKNLAYRFAFLVDCERLQEGLFGK
ncbi:hypothetical protein UlMin_010940 [Ulmus minor]